MRRGITKVSLYVCLIEQNPLAREFLTGILQKSPSVTVLGIEALTSSDIGGSPAPVFILDNCDLPLPLSECLRRLRFHYPEAKFLVIDRELRKEDILRLLWLKVDGFLPYGEVVGSLVTAIHSVTQGNIWISREILREYVQCGRAAQLKNSSQLESMTTREAQILELVNRRLSNKEIADILRVRECTVKFHLSNIYSKLQVTNRHDIIRGESGPSEFGHFLTALIPSTSKA